MTWNGLGTFDPPGLPEFPAVANDLIRAAYFNVVIQALCDAFVNTIPRDGQAPLTGDIDGNALWRIKNLPAAIAIGQPIRFEEFVALQTTVNGLASVLEPFVYINQGII